MAIIQNTSQVFRNYAKNLAVVYNRRKDVRAYMELLLSISVIIGFGLFAIKPTLLTIIELNKQINAKEETLSLLDQKIDALEEAQGIFSRNRDLVELLSTAVPNSPFPVRYSRQLEGLSKRAGTSIISVSTGEAVLSGASHVKQDASQAQDLELLESIDTYPSEVSSLVYTIDVSGDYPSIVLFLQQLESLRRSIFIDIFSMRLEDETLGEGLIFSISGRVPYLSRQ